MASIAVKESQIVGTTTGEHGGHYINGVPVHPSPSPITGTISSGCMDRVIANGKSVAVVGSITSEFDVCTNGTGKVATGSGRVFINGNKVARVGDDIDPHNGTAHISTGDDRIILLGG